MSIKFQPLKTIKELNVPANTRLARIIRKGKGKDVPSLGCFVPLVTAEDIQQLISMPDVLVWLKGKVSEVQDTILKAHAKDGTELNDDIINTNSILLQIVRERGLDKENIESWFNADLKPLLVNVIKTKKPSISDTQLANACKVFLDGFLQFVKSDDDDILITPSTKEQLIKALELLPDDYSNTVSEQIASRLVAMEDIEQENYL